jgi:hypothetical protein
MISDNQKISFKSQNQSEKKKLYKLRSTISSNEKNKEHIGKTSFIE